MSFSNAKQFESYLPHIRRQWQAEQAEWEVRRAQALDTAVLIANMLRAQYQVQAVYLFGSTTEPTLFDQHSDIDLAVTGLAPQHFYRAYAEASALATPFELDLLDLDAENLPPAVRQMILQEGQRL